MVSNHRILHRPQLRHLPVRYASDRCISDHPLVTPVPHMQAPLAGVCQFRMRPVKPSTAGYSAISPRVKSFTGSTRFR